jgi:hypothetical protein
MAATGRMGGFFDDSEIDRSGAASGNVYPPVGASTGSIAITVPVRN